MTVDTVVKIGESEKCALDMSSYEDLNSASRNVGGDGDGKDDYVFVNGSDVVVLDDRVVNRENGEVNGDRVGNREGEGVSEEELSVEDGGGGGKVNGDVVLSEDYVENHENKEASEVKLSVEGDDLVESREVNEAELSVEGGDNVEVSDDVVLSDDLVENCENEGKVSVDGDGNVVLSDDRVENHENKDVKVYDDVVLSDDRVENHGNREVNVAELSVESDDNVKVTEDGVLSDDHVGNHVIGEVSLEEDDSFKVNGDAETDILDKEVENGVGVGEAVEREVDGVGSVVEIGEINSGNEVVHAANGIIPEHVVDEVTERNDLKPVVDDVKEAESVVETGDNDNASVDIVDSRSLDSAEVKAEDNAAVNGAPDALVTSEVKEGSVPEPVVDEVRGGIEPESVVDDVKEVDATIGAIGSRSLDVDNNNTRTDSVTQESAEVESEDSTAVNGVPDAPEFSEIEAQIKAPTVEMPEGGLEEEQQTVPSVENGTENNGDVHTELEPADYPVMESEHLKADGSDQSIENGLANAQSLDTEGKSLLNDANATPVEESSDLQQEHIPSVDGENQKRDLIEVEANTDGQVDAVEPVAGGEIQELVDSEVVGSELDQCETGDNRDQVGLDSLPSQSEGAQNHGNLELAAREMDNPVSIIAGQSDERKIELTAESVENGEALTGMQFDTTDKPALEDETEIVNGVAESEVITETGGIQGALKDHVAEQTRSFDVVDKDISSVDCSLDQNDEGGSYARENVAESKDAPASEESSEEAGNGLRSDSLNSVAESSAPSESENVKEQGVGNDISAADNSVSDSAFDTKSKTEAVDSETDVAIKTNTIFDGTSGPGISFGSFGSGPPLSYNEINSRSDVLNKHTAVSTPRDGVVLTSPANGDHSNGFNHDSTCSKVARSEQIDEVSASSVEGSEADSSDARNGNPDLVRKPFYWLIKVPRFDEEKYKEALRQSEIELAEKTKARDACQAEFNKQQAYCRELRSDLEATNSEAKPARELVWAKSRELDSVHSSLNLARHGITTEDLDNKIHNLEHRMQHQTLNNLREEKELVREIKQLNLQRQKLSTDPERLQAIQQARAQRDQTEDQLKVLKKELNALKENLAKAEERFRAARKKHNDESVLLNDLKDQLRSANDIRQEAYIRLITLRKQLNEKNTPFFKAKNDLRIAYNYVTAGNKDGLEHHCVNQVEKIMEMWNKNDEFRKEYIESNYQRTVRKFGMPDGTYPGIDEESPSLGDFADRRVNSSAKANSDTENLTREIDLTKEPKPTEDKLLKKEDQKAASPVKKIEVISKNNLAKAPEIIETQEEAEKPKLTKEEEELAKKAEQLKREEEAARLMEQRRLEEKVKAEEALERKRRNALKAQARAEFKARKEAEEKEKEREKRAKKKGKKRGINVEITENEPAQPSEPSSESVKESEVTEKLATKAKRPQKAPSHSKQIKTTKPIPAALRNKGKRGLLHYWPYPLIVLLAIALFYLGSYERIQTIRQHISALLHR